MESTLLRVFPQKAVAGSKRTAKKQSNIAFVEEKYWEEFKMLQQYKERHSQINWTNTPDRMRYKVIVPEILAPEMPEYLTDKQLEPEPVDDSVSVKKKRPSKGRSKSRSVTRSLAGAPFVVSSALVVLLLGPDLEDNDTDGLPNWWEWRFFGTKMSSPPAENDYTAVE